MDDLFDDDAALIEEDHLDIDVLAKEEDEKLGDEEDELEDFLPGSADYDHGFGDEE